MSDSKVSKNWFLRHKILSTIVVLIIIIVAVTTSNSKNTKSTSNSTTPATTATPTTDTTTQPAKATTSAQRQVKGKAVTLGAGTFTGGKDVAVGLYNVTTTSGQSGNFIVTGKDNYDEILGVSDGEGVPEVRAQISNGDQIQISGLSSVTFTPVTTPYVTSYSAVNLYAGTWTVGQDIGTGRYVATTTAGSSGNFIVEGVDSVDEILGQSDGEGVPSVTTNLSKGDVISISGLSQVTMTPTK